MRVLENWKRKESTRNWPISGKSSKVCDPSFRSHVFYKPTLTWLADGNLSGYHKKKYVCKLLYIYILGWNVDFGHLEAVNLISATKYSEKQIGYLAMTLFLHEQHELLHLVVNSIRKDLMDHNELFNCLALHAIANVGGREMGEALSGEVHRLLISPYVSGRGLYSCAHLRLVIISLTCT